VETLNQEEMVERMSKLEAKVENLEGWQKNQNGTIRQVDSKVDKLQFWIMTTAVAAAVNIAIGLIK